VPRLLLPLLLMAIAFAGAPASAAPDVDVALVLAVDCSYSVDEKEYLAEIEGMADALRSKEVKAAIASGPHASIAVSVLQWSDKDAQRLALPWTLLRSSAEVDNFAVDLAHMPRLKTGYTSISGAMQAGIEALTSLTFHPDRRIIDISTDGTNNDGVQPDIVRELASERGIIINGLAITREVSYLDLYFQHHVIVGPGSFVIKADDQVSYHEAMRRKLLREVSAPVS
jgi:hypothetical protein